MAMLPFWMMLTSKSAALNLSITVALSPVAIDGMVTGVARLINLARPLGRSTVILPVGASPVLVMTSG